MWVAIEDRAVERVASKKKRISGLLGFWGLGFRGLGFRISDPWTPMP